MVALRAPAGAQSGELGPALSDQANTAAGPSPPEAEFADRCLDAIRKTQSHRAVRDFAQLLQQRRTPATYVLLRVEPGACLRSAACSATRTSWRRSAGMGAASSQHILAGQWWRLLAATALRQAVAHHV